MKQKIRRLYPTAPLENNDLEQRLERKIKIINSFRNSIKNIKKMITYFKNKNHKSKNKLKKIKHLLQYQNQSTQLLLLVQPQRPYRYWSTVLA